MKKIMLSLALLSSIPSFASTIEQVPEPMPEPVVTDPAVAEALNCVEASDNSEEYQKVTEVIEKLDRDFLYTIPDGERRKIMRVLRRLAETGQLSMYNINARKAQVILGVIQGQFIRMGLKAGLTENCAIRVSAPPTQDFKRDLDRYGTYGFIVSKYTGYSAQNKFRQEASLKKYDHCRC